jgi:hypothetical protein
LRPTLWLHGTAGVSGLSNLNEDAARETLPFSLWPSIDFTEEV